MKKGLMVICIFFAMQTICFAQKIADIQDIDCKQIADFSVFIAMEKQKGASLQQSIDRASKYRLVADRKQNELLIQAIGKNLYKSYLMLDNVDPNDPKAKKKFYGKMRDGVYSSCLKDQKRARRGN